MKSCVLIPAYNCSLTIEAILSKIKELGLDVVVVDDGSHDGTGDIARSMGATVIKHEKNAGKGSSIKSLLVSSWLIFVRRGANGPTWF